MSEAAELIHEIEMQISEAQKIIDLGAALERLTNNSKDFEMVITKGYFNDEAVQLVKAKAMPHMATHQESVDNALMSISNLYQYFVKVQQSTELAKSAIEASQEEIVSIEDEESFGVSE